MFVSSGPTSSDSFDWGDAAVGAGGAIVVLLVAAGGARATATAVAVTPAGPRQRSIEQVKRVIPHGSRDGRACSTRVCRALDARQIRSLS